jgi:hypothetical protein
MYVQCIQLEESLNGLQIKLNIYPQTSEIGVLQMQSHQNLFENVWSGTRRPPALGGPLNFVNTVRLIVTPLVRLCKNRN